MQGNNRHTHLASPPRVVACDPFKDADETNDICLAESFGWLTLQRQCLQIDKNHLEDQEISAVKCMIPPAVKASFLLSL